MRKSLALLVVFVLVLLACVSAVALGEMSAEGGFENGYLTGRLVSVDKAGNRVYHVTVDSSAEDVYGNRLTARDYGCALLLVKWSNSIQLISEMDFTMTVSADLNPENALTVLSHKMLGLNSINGKNGLHIEGDLQRALEMLSAVAAAEEVQISDPMVPLSAGSDEGEDEEVQTPSEGDELVAFEPVLKRHDYKTIRVGDDFLIEVSGISEGAYIQLPEGIGFDEDQNLRASSARNKENLSYKEKNNGSVREVHIAPDSGEVTYYILLTANEAGSARLVLRSVDGGESIVGPLQIEIKPSEEEETEEEPEEAPEAETAIAPVIQLMMEHEGETLTEGTKVTITATITGVPEDESYALQWQNDLSGEFIDVPGETGASVTFEANEENVSCAWRVALMLISDAE